MFGVAFLFFKIQNAIMKGGIRPTAEMEIAGLDMPEMGAVAYPDFIEQEAVTLHAGTSPTHEFSQRRLIPPIQRDERARQ